MAFLSLLDDRVRAKGSRDPLAFESVWTTFGRRVVGNLTTVTSSWINFAVALLGFHWGNERCRDVRASISGATSARIGWKRRERLTGFFLYSVEYSTRIKPVQSPASRSRRVNTAVPDVR